MDPLFIVQMMILGSIVVSVITCIIVYCMHPTTHSTSSHTIIITGGKSEPPVNHDYDLNPASHNPTNIPAPKDNFMEHEMYHRVMDNIWNS